MARFVLVFTLAACAMVAWPGCRPDEEDARPRVGVLVPTGSTPVAQAMRRAVTAYADSYGAVVSWRDGDERDPALTPAEQERQSAAELIEEERVQALVYTPSDAQAASDVLRDAEAAGVPVIALDTIPKNFSVDGIVMVPPVYAGEIAATVALEHARRRRRVNVEGVTNALVIEGSWQSDADRDVARGFYNILDADPTVRVLSHTSTLTPTEAFQFVSRELNSYAGNVQLLLVASTDYVPGALLAARTHGLADWLISAGVGAGAEACRLINENAHDYEMDGRPAERATLAVRVARGLVDGEPVAPDGVYLNGTAELLLYRQEPRVISRDNVREMQELWPNLYPQ
jgi:ABC-type sugar transport system substrate-binding protein